MAGSGSRLEGYYISSSSLVGPNVIGTPALATDISVGSTHWFVPLISLGTSVQGTWTNNIDGNYFGTVIFTNESGAKQLNDEMDFNKIYLAAGTYTFDFIASTANNKCIFNVYLDAQDISGAIDTYSGGTVKNVQFINAGVVVATSGLKSLKVKVTGKHVGSDYGLYLHAMEWVRTT